eukprot:TRINITY_DN61349_c0_g1_i1.p1 TRINITY_DN61349_c0_g1~~TRINITY_DN61349_c0_g1_i1.p1  ORF type:complete len:529 (+),score=156.60 TRINITY_DN61349_c0_g1_i1:117-1703(+)
MPNRSDPTATPGFPVTPYGTFHVAPSLQESGFARPEGRDAAGLRRRSVALSTGAAVRQADPAPAHARGVNTGDLWRGRHARRRPGTRRGERDRREDRTLGGTVRSMCTCKRFDLPAIYSHYSGRHGVEATDTKEGLVWVTVSVPTYKFDGEPEAESHSPEAQYGVQTDADASQEVRQSSPKQREADKADWSWAQGDEAAEEVGKERGIEWDEAGDSDAEPFYRVLGAGEKPSSVRQQYEEDFRRGREHTMHLFFFQDGVLVWWTPFPPDRCPVNPEGGSDEENQAPMDLILGGEALIQEVERMRPVFEAGSKPTLSGEHYTWSLQRNQQAHTDASESEHDAVRRSHSRTQKEDGCRIVSDHFFLTEVDSKLMLAYSWGLAQSAKLADFEQEIDDLVEDTKRYPQLMAMEGSAELDRHDIAKIRGRLFLQRMEVNIMSDILETPDYFWNRPDVEPLYLQVRRYTEITARADVLNKRLEIVNELFEVLHDEINTHHANWLEWIIIWLIVVELIVGLLSAALTGIGMGLQD